MIQAERYLCAVLLLFGGAWLCGHLAGCRSPAATTSGSRNHAIPNLLLVEEPAIYRGGQPDPAGWQWLRSAGVSNVVKLNTMEEASDKPATALGMRLSYFPIDTMEQLLDGPDSEAMRDAVAAIRPGTFIHCEHGMDRTGLVVGLYRLKEGTNAAAAWAEMLRCGFHPALLGLRDFWREATETNHTAP